MKRKKRRKILKLNPAPAVAAAPAKGNARWDIVAADGTPIDGSIPLNDAVIESLARLLRNEARNETRGLEPPDGGVR